MLRPPRPGARVVVVREAGAKIAAVLCQTVRATWHRLPTADMPARVLLVPGRAPAGTVVALYVAIRDDARDPYRAETFLNPAEPPAPDGDATRLGQYLLLQLARQTSTYLIVVDEAGALLLNRRVTFDPATLQNLAQVAQEVQQLAAGPALPPDRFGQAAQWHMDSFPLSNVTV